MDEQTKGHESARQAQESARRAQQHTREATNEATHQAGQLAGLGAEALGVWADVTQHTLRDVLALSSQATQEGARQMVEWQQTNVDLLQQMQAAAFRWSTIWPEAFRDPIRCYQRALEESLDATQRVFGLARHNAESTTQAFRRLESAASDTTRTLGETFRDAATRMQDVYARSDRLRAA